MNEVSAASLQRKNQNLISEDKCTSHISLKLTAVRNKLATLCPLVELLPQRSVICQTKAVGYAHNTRDLNI